MKSGFWIILAVLVGFIGVIAIRGSGTAPTPEVFAEGTALGDAVAESKETGTPVFAVVTASWCGPCQRLKNDTLSDERVASWLSANTIPVSIDADADRDAAAGLGVSNIPASFILKDGEPVASRVGYADPESYLAFLKEGVSGG